MKKLLLLGLIVIISIAGCVETDTTTVTPTSGTLQVRITDKVENVSSLIITISEIKVHKASQGTVVNQTEGQETNETGNAGWITVIGEETIDLIEVKGVEEILGEATLSTGLYTQVRLSVSNATATIDGETHDLRIPSKSIKFVRPFEIKSNQVTSILIDFDADKSIVKTGKKYILKPVVKIIKEKPEEEPEEPEINLEELCVNESGNVTTSLCCNSTEDFPNTCLIGPCGCSPENSHEVKICDCGEGKCWNETSCVDIE
jgi:hypothetical protein